MEGRAVVLAHDILSERAHGGDLMSLVAGFGTWRLRALPEHSRSLAAGLQAEFLPPTGPLLREG